MRIILFISLLIISLHGLGQVTYTWRYYNESVGSLQGYYLVGMPSDSITNANKRPGIFMFPGLGETGAGNTTLAKAIKYGPHRDVYAGLADGGVIQDNGYSDSTVYPIYFHLQSNDANGSIGNTTTLRALFNGVFNDYSSYLDTNQLHIAGLSIGGREALLALANYPGSTDNYTFANKFASAFISSAGGRTSNITDNAAIFGEYATRGGRMFYTTGAADVASPRYDTATIISMMNDIIPGSAEGHTWHTSDGFTTEGHGGWDTLWKHDRDWYFLNGLNAEEYQLRFTKTPMAVAQTTVNTTTNDVVLNGVSNGWYREREWTQISGPTSTIDNDDQDTTAIDMSGGTGTYVFRFTVTNTNDSRTATHDVTVNYTAIDAPIADAGSDQNIITSTTTLTGSGTPGSPETITDYLWTKESGTGGSITSPTSATTGITGLTAGEYVFRLTVTQSDAQTAYDEITVTVVDPAFWDGYIIRKKHYQKIRLVNKN